MKLLCVNNLTTTYGPGGKKSKHESNLTIGFWYKMIDDCSTHYMVINDIGMDMFYSKRDNMFITEKEYRKLKLNKLNNVSFSTLEK